MQDGLLNPQDDSRPRDFTGLDDPQLHLVVHDTCKLEKLGGRKNDGYGAWTLCTNHLRPGGIVYSFGIGGDVSFDNEMVNRGYKVFGFDPTVTLDHVSNLFKNNHERDQPSAFQFCQVGIGAVDGIITFFSPKNPHLKSKTAVKHEELSKRYESRGMPAPVMRLPTFMCTNGHGFIDVLKIDVEGVEFDICDEWLRMDTPLPVGQVLLEFHDRLLKDGKLRKKACLEVMAREGFTEVYVSPGAGSSQGRETAQSASVWFGTVPFRSPFPFPFRSPFQREKLGVIMASGVNLTAVTVIAAVSAVLAAGVTALNIPSGVFGLHPKPHVLPFFCTCDDDSALMEDSLARCQVASDFLIALAYLSIPLELAYFTFKARSFSHRWVMLLFSLFIVLCAPLGLGRASPQRAGVPVLSIPLELAYFTLKARSFSHRWVMLLFSLFIVLCGTDTDTPCSMHCDVMCAALLFIVLCDDECVLLPWDCRFPLFFPYALPLHCRGWMQGRVANRGPWPGLGLSSSSHGYTCPSSASLPLHASHPLPPTACPSPLPPSGLTHLVNVWTYGAHPRQLRNSANSLLLATPLSLPGLTHLVNVWTYGAHPRQLRNSANSLLLATPLSLPGLTHLVNVWTYGAHPRQLRNSANSLLLATPLSLPGLTHLVNVWTYGAHPRQLRNSANSLLLATPLSLPGLTHLVNVWTYGAHPRQLRNSANSLLLATPLSLPGLTHLVNVWTYGAHPRQLRNSANSLLLATPLSLPGLTHLVNVWTYGAHPRQLRNSANSLLLATPLSLLGLTHLVNVWTYGAHPRQLRNSANSLLLATPLSLPGLTHLVNVWTYGAHPRQLRNSANSLLLATPLSLPGLTHLVNVWTYGAHPRQLRNSANSLLLATPLSLPGLTHLVNVWTYGAHPRQLRNSANSLLLATPLSLPGLTHLVNVWTYGAHPRQLRNSANSLLLATPLSLPGLTHLVNVWTYGAHPRQLRNSANSLLLATPLSLPGLTHLVNVWTYGAHPRQLRNSENSLLLATPLSLPGLTHLVNVWTYGAHPRQLRNSANSLLLATPLSLPGLTHLVNVWTYGAHPRQLRNSANSLLLATPLSLPGLTHLVNVWTYGAHPRQLRNSANSLLLATPLSLPGLTHLVNVWTYGAHPRQLSVVQTVLKVLCAAVSWGTAFVLFTIIPSLLKFKATFVLFTIIPSLLKFKASAYACLFELTQEVPLLHPGALPLCSSPSSPRCSSSRRVHFFIQGHFESSHKVSATTPAAAECGADGAQAFVLFTIIPSLLKFKASACLLPRVWCTGFFRVPLHVHLTCLLLALVKTHGSIRLSISRFSLSHPPRPPPFPHERLAGAGAFAAAQGCAVGSGNGCHSEKRGGGAACAHADIRDPPVVGPTHHPQHHASGARPGAHARELHRVDARPL
ncbi:unnamed protein product [Closterium sp. Yama58-4]|nr:unnamed protein product [Closterium sp. Yama58-4]